MIKSFAVPTRGERNNNPGNIRKSKTAWQGKVDNLAGVVDEVSFVQFSSASYGIRAIGKIIGTYYNKYNLVTVHDIISRWAPDSENDTGAYVGAVCVSCGVSENEQLVLNAKTLANIVTAIIYHENGRCIYPPQYILDGLAL